MRRVKKKTGGVRVIAFARMLVPGQVHDRAEHGTPPELKQSVGTVIVDLNGVAFLDLTCMVALLRFCADVRAGGGEVCLASLSGRARLQAQKMQLHRLVEIFNTVDEALRSLTASSSLATDVPGGPDKRPRIGVRRPQAAPK